MSIESFSVSAGRQEVLEGHRSHHYHVVEVRTRWGHSFTHHFRFPDTNQGLGRANYFAAHVEDFIRANGVEKLDLNHWDKRTIYGTDAYLDEEPALVENEIRGDLRDEGIF